MGDSEDNGGGGEGSDDVNKGSMEPVLVSPSDSYSNNEILVSDSRYSSCPVYTDTDYCLKKNINNFGLRRPFYSE